MRNKIIFLIIALAILAMATGYKQYENTDYSEQKDTKEVIENNFTTSDSTAYHLLQKNCMSCHSAKGKTHDELIAPPIIAVKRHYMMTFDKREDFINGIVAWSKNPKEDKAIMKGAIDRFKTMPYMNFEEEELEKIAAFIYDNEMEKPSWFEDHFKEMHPDGKMRKESCKGKCKGKCKEKCKGKCNGKRKIG